MQVIYIHSGVCSFLVDAWLAAALNFGMDFFIF